MMSYRQYFKFEEKSKISTILKNVFGAESNPRKDYRSS